MKNKNIYTNQSQELLTLFEDAGNVAKVMCVPIDYAKKDLNRRGNCFPAQSGIYRNLRTLVRHRKKLVTMSTEVKNRIHTG